MLPDEQSHGFKYILQHEIIEDSGEFGFKGALYRSTRRRCTTIALQEQLELLVCCAAEVRGCNAVDKKKATEKQNDTWQKKG